MELLWTLQIPFPLLSLFGAPMSISDFLECCSRCSGHRHLCLKSVCFQRWIFSIEYLIHVIVSEEDHFSCFQHSFAGCSSVCMVEDCGLSPVHFGMSTFICPCSAYFYAVMKLILLCISSDIFKMHRLILLAPLSLAILPKI